jgi:hypothetical protein
MQGSAYLLPFYQGLVQGLTDAGALKPTTVLAGLSGGALTSALLAVGVSGERQFNETTAMIGTCAEEGNPGCRPLNGKLALLLGGLLPPDAGTAVGDRVRVWVSALNSSSPTLAGSVPYGVTGFQSNADLESALFASDMIPCFSDDRPYNLVRGVPAIDGGFSSDFAELCTDARAAGARCVTAATAVVNAKATADGGASLKGGACPAQVSGSYALPKGAARAGSGGAAPLAPPTTSQADWALPTACPPPGTDPATIWPPFIAQASTLSPEGALPDLYPGARTDALKDWKACDWLTFALKPDFSRWQSVYDAGLAEAGAWALEEGYCVEKEVSGGVAAAEGKQA